MEQNKRKFTTKQFKKLVYDFAGEIKVIRDAQKNEVISEELRNRINLAVTEVNGCALCSYKHTKEALEMGMSEDDLKMYLSGDLQNAGEDESVALMFAQHYAETSGEYSMEAWQRVVDTYGDKKAAAIMANTKAIMFGNAHGIAVGSLGSRIKGKPVKDSNLKDELGVVFSVFVFLPAALIKSAFTKKSET